MSHSEHLDEAHLAGLVMLEPEDPEARAARAHIAGCDACRAAFADAEATLRVLDADLDAPPPRDLVARGLRIEAEAHGQPARGPLPWLLAALLAAAGLLLAWLGIGETIAAQSALKCAAVELTTGAMGITGALLYARRAHRGLTAGHGAIAGGVGALGGELYLHLACGDHHAVHLLWVHGGVVLLAMLLGGIAARTSSAPATA